MRVKHLPAHDYRSPVDAVNLALASGKISPQLQEIYQENFFPAMQVRWTAYPSNTGHWIFPGCWRCHDGQHQSSDGTIVPSDCTTCHIIVSQGKPGQEEYMQSDQGLKFQHPAPIGGLWQQVPCTACHSGGA